MGSRDHQGLQGVSSQELKPLCHVRPTSPPVYLGRCAVQDDADGSWTASEVEHHEVLQQVAAQQTTAQQIAKVQGDTGIPQHSKAHTENKLRPPVPNLRIVIMVAGTRGDVQPFIALGLRLQVGDSLKCWDLALDLALIAKHASPE